MLKPIKILTALTLFSLLISCSPKKPEPKQMTEGTKQTTYFGAKPSMKVAALSLKDAISNKKFDKKIALQGNVSKVCQKSGCWMIIQDDETIARVTFKDYGFFMPKDIPGKTVKMEGVLSHKTMSEKDARHFAKDEGKSQQEIDAIKGEQMEYAYLADSVTMVN